MATRKTKKSAAKVIRWTRPEQEALAVEGARIWTERGERSRIECLRMAQDNVLPVDRRRTLDGVTSVVWFNREMQARVGPAIPGAARKRGAKSAADAATIARIEQHNAEEHALLDAVQARNVPPAPAVAANESDAWDAPPPPPTSVSGALALLRSAAIGFMSDFAREVAEHITQQLVHQVVESLQPGGAIAQATNGLRHVAPSTRVLIAGLNDASAAQVSRDFGDVLKIKFWNKDQSPDVLRTLAGRADYTVGMIDFIGHSHTQILKARSPNHMEVSGGMTALRARLNQIASGHADPSPAPAPQQMAAASMAQ